MTFFFLKVDMAFITSTDDLFEDEIMKSPSAVVQFSATWCGPCQTLKPIMEKVSDEMSDKFKFYYHIFCNIFHSK